MSANDKMALYFSTLNSLSSKIFSEVQLIDESIQLADKGKTLTYDERCAVIDKVLIHDALHCKRSKPIHRRILEGDESGTDLGQKLLKTIVFQDEILNENQTDACLHFIYPKKPEKYVFDESGCWVDEHSEPFSYFKQSQAKCCGLEGLVQRMLAESSDINRNSEGKGQAPLPKAFDQMEEKPIKEKKKSRAPFCGVNVMGGLDGSHDSLEEKLRSIKGPEVQQREAAEEHEKEANLPKQKQNLDLIAELQAKLDKNNKITKNMNCAPPPPPPSAGTNHSSQKEKSALAIGSPMTAKINKPKAPPPPPPAAPPKIETPDKMPKQHKQASKSLGSSDVDEKAESSSSKPSGTRNEEFVVDVSSPCRIATPKTGFDFLDNW